ncbi:MAG: hypothetical protein EOO38_30280 [Cytophagaceae bacterium]|nr:MAG: hypothetical protein EOO38_30280 [Cytophagaceae bacterium]
MKTNLLRLTVVCMVNLCSPLAFSGTGPVMKCVPDQSAIDVIAEVPECPGKGSRISGLGNTYPTGSVFVNLRYGEQSNYEFISEIYQFIAEQKTSLAMKLNLVTDRLDVQSVKENVTSYPGMLEIINDTRHVNVLPINYDSSGITWTQDWLQFVYSSGKPTLFRNTYQGDTYKATPDAVVLRRWRDEGCAQRQHGDRDVGDAGHVGCHGDPGGVVRQ